MIGRIHDMTADLNGNLIVSFIIRKEKRINVIEELQNLKDKDLNIEVKEDKPKRSLNANAYFHVLADKIAEKMKLGMEEVKHNLVIEYGTTLKDDDGQVVGIKLPSSVKVESVYKYAKWFDTREENGRYFDCYIIYKQTHTLNSSEMAKLIDGTAREAEELGIETLEEVKIKQLINSWETKDE